MSYLKSIGVISIKQRAIVPMESFKLDETPPSPKDNLLHHAKKNRRYGWGSFRPDCLQVLNRPPFFLACLCALVVGQGIACTGINNTMITSIEKRYGLSTTTIGLFSTTFHITVGLFVSIICYLGHRHRPFTLGLGCLFIAAGLFVITIPHYLTPRYEAGVALDTDTCRKSLNDSTQINATTCAGATDDQSRYLFIFFLGYILMGLGVAPLYSLGYAHLDDIVERGKNSKYFGIMGASSAVGPALGFFLANPLLNIFVDLKQVSCYVFFAF